jgi:predicted amidohydrolase YtcJ
MKTLFTGDEIWCGRNTYTEAVLVEAGKVIALGSDALQAGGDEVIDLTGKFLAPGFIDAHAHPLFAGREGQGPNVNGLQSVAEIVAAVRTYIASNPSATWVIGGAYEASVVAGGDFEAASLDEASRDIPIVLHAVDHHTIWVNSKALEIAGITAATVDPDGGAIARYSDGSPKGTLREPSAIDLVLAAAPKRTLSDDVAAIGWACQRYLEAGVTSTTDAWVEPGMPEAYIAADKGGVLTIDTNLFFLAQPDTWRSYSKDFVSFRSEIEALPSSSHLTAKTIKFICDGALSAGTAALLEPYLDVPQSTGLLIWSEDELIDAMVHFDALGFQIHAHAIGDAAIRQALNAIEAVTKINPHWDRRAVIAHAQLIHPDDLPRFASLGVIANIQPLWTYLDPMNAELIEPRIGTKRNNQQYQLASLQRSGARIGYGSDWPVTSHAPLEALAVPTHRSAPGSSQAWSPQEAVSLEDSLVHYTQDAAYSNFWNKGVIAVGADADFVVLDKNPLEVAPEKVNEIEVLQVFTRGQVVLTENI